MTEQAHEVLDTFLTQRGMTNREFARRVQLVRRHASIPSGPQVSHWRCGRNVPDHDMRVWIDIASEGAVPADAWREQASSNRRSKMEQQQTQRRFWFAQKGDEGQRYLHTAETLRDALRECGYIPSGSDDELVGDYADGTDAGHNNCRVWEDV